MSREADLKVAIRVLEDCISRLKNKRADLWKEIDDYENDLEKHRAELQELTDPITGGNDGTA